MRPVFLALPLLALCLSACQRQPDTPGGHAASERHEHFEEIGKAFKAITKQTKKDAPDMAIVRFNAGKLDSLALRLQTWFPKGSSPADGVRTEALQAVWDRPDEFRQAAARFINEAGKFKALAAVGNAAALDPAAQALGGACKGCHDRFREND